MKHNKITAGFFALIMALSQIQGAAVMAVQNKVIKSQVSEYKFQNINLDWWKNYHDEYLDSYIVKAVNENYDLKVATLRVEEARQMVKLQFSKELPTAGVGVFPALVKMQGSTSSETLTSFPILVNYEADIFLKNHDKTKAAKKMYDVSKLQEQAAYISVVSAVGATYFNIVKLDKLISIQNDIIKSRSNIYNLMKDRNAQGLTSTAELVKANKSLVLAKSDLIDLEKARTIMLNSLAVLIGDSPENISEYKRISYDELAALRLVPAEISSEVITSRPDYKISEKQLEKAGIDVKVAKKEFLPTFNIGGLLMFAASSATNSMNWSSALAGLGGGALLPLFTGGAKFANLKLSKNKYEQVLAQYQKTNLVSIQEVNDALCALKMDHEKLNKNIATYNMQKQDYSFYKVRYEQGVISKLDLLQQDEALLVMNKLVILSKTDCLIAEIGLYKATGAKI